MRDASNKKATEVAVECKNYPMLMVLLQHGEDINEILKTVAITYIKQWSAVIGHF